MNLLDTTIFQMAGVGPSDELAAVLSARGNIMQMTQKAEEAVLCPRDSGAFDHQLRAALAARIARLAEDETLANHYEGNAGGFADLAQSETTGAVHGLGDVVAFVDRVANQTRDVASQDIATLQGAGVLDADIVRLCELVAFVSYQVRVVAGLRLMQEVSK